MLRYNLFLVAGICLTTATQQPEIPLDDARLTIHTLLREDVFAGVLDNDMDRLARGEKNIAILLQKRPADKAGLLAWKASTVMYRAILARDDGRGDEFQANYDQAIGLLAQARKIGPNDLGVAAATAGMYAMLADRLPKNLRDAAWATAYENYLALWKVQSGNVEQLPAHLRGELLGGLALSAQRTGKMKELADYLDKILAVMPDTKYAEAARAWRDTPNAAADNRITCLGCHAAGRLAARRAALGDK
jgi:tetratricopeptide (TPR) repeat protein